MKISKRGSVSPFLVMEALSRANAYIAEHNAEVVHLSLGQPGKGVPARVAEKLRDLVMNDKLGYTEGSGMLELRKRIAQHYHETYGVDVPWERIFITVGSSSAFFLSLIAAFDAGDRVALVQPCYPAYRNMLIAHDLEPVLLRGTFENNFQPTVAMLEALDTPIDGLIIASPSNPTGTVLPEKEMRAIVKYCEANNIRIISDEIYHGMSYNAKTATALAMSDSAIVVNSFSKYFLMAGWRLGWVVAPADLVRSYESLVQHFFVSPPALAQHAALEVFNCKDELDSTVAEYAQNRAIMLEALPKIGFSHICPAEGAFYIYANVSDLTDNSADFCEEMLRGAGVVGVSGHDFDTEQGDAYVRLSYSGTRADIENAMARLKGWLDTRQPKARKAS